MLWKEKVGEDTVHGVLVLSCLANYRPGRKTAIGVYPVFTPRTESRFKRFGKRDVIQWQSYWRPSIAVDGDFVLRFQSSAGTVTRSLGRATIVWNDSVSSPPAVLTLRGSFIGAANYPSDASGPDPPAGATFPPRPAILLFRFVAEYACINVYRVSGMVGRRSSTYLIGFRV